MKRGGPIRRDVGKARDWQERSAKSYQAKRAAPQAYLGVRKAAPRRNDGPWRADCLARRGRFCRATELGGCAGPLQVDHVWPRSQGGPSVVSNGLVLCAEHHRQKTSSTLRIRRSWLEPDQTAFLADAGWVWWQADGSPAGRGCRHFERVVGNGG